MKPQPLSFEEDPGRTDFWTFASVLAAQLTAEGKLTNAQIAEKVGKSRAWLRRVQGSPQFKERVREVVQELADEARRIGLANQTVRLLAKNERWDGLRQILNSRAADARYKHVPGWSTGLLKVRLEKYGDDFIETFEVDTGLLRALLALEAQVAEELGQVGGKGNQQGANITIIRNVPDLGV